MKCINCGNENKNTNIRCEFCGNEINTINPNYNFLNKDYSQDNAMKIKLDVKKNNRILIFVLSPLLLILLILTGVFVYTNISENNKTQNYLKTEGRLSGYKNCEYDDEENDEFELCNAVYEYIVDKATYEASPPATYQRGSFKTTLTIKYNPNNPSEHVFVIDSSIIYILGIIILVTTLIIFTFLKSELKLFFNNDEIIKK